MRKLKLFFVTAIAAAAMVAPAANAQTTALVIGAGSSALWQTAAIGAFRNLAGAGAHHYTIKGSCGPANCAQIFDSRSSAIAVQGGNLWVVWSADQSKVWAYISVDSVVGNRAFFAVPRARLQISPDTEITNGQNLISSNLWGADAAALPPAVYGVLNSHPFTAAFTDIRPEDAKFAQSRAVGVLGQQPQGGLGYGSGPNTLVGTEIESAYSSTFAQPVNFSLGGGTDPFNPSLKVPASVTIPVGAAPVVFFINRTNPNGLGKAGVTNNMTHAHLQAIFSGTNCAIAGVPVTVVQREPISGTMNTAEFTEFQGFGGGQANSQENGVNAQNPLNKACAAGGKRTRAIGTGELVSAVTSTKDSIGYSFWGFGNFSKIANNNGYHYLMVDSSDPIHATYSNGLLPPCGAACPAAPGSTFPNVRNGNYKSWSVLRVVTDASGPNRTNTQNLVTATQNNVNSTVPDFVPFNAAAGDPGLKLYRSHFQRAGVAPNNGLSGQTEAGGDVGGCIETKGPAPGVLNCHQ